MKTLNRLYPRASAYLLGLWEFRSSLTSSPDEIECYDLGREHAYRLTLRIFEEA